MKLIRRKNKVSSHHSPSERKYILGDNTSFVVDEAYNTLRSNIVFSMPGKGCKVVEFTSCGMSDGKSINVLNTAITFAETNVKVLLIDCDLRRPNINRLLARKSSPGLTNVLVNACTLEEAIVRIDDYNLDVIFSGYLPPNPSELLSSDALAELMETLKERYDYIFIDCPPSDIVADTSIITKYADRTIFIIRAGMLERSMLPKLQEDYDTQRFPNMMLILNGTIYENNTYGNRYGYSYAYGYGYYGSNSKDYYSKE